MMKIKKMRDVFPLGLGIGLQKESETAILAWIRAQPSRTGLVKLACVLAVSLLCMNSAIANPLALVKTAGRAVMQYGDDAGKAALKTGGAAGNTAVRAGGFAARTAARGGNVVKVPPPQISPDVVRAGGAAVGMAAVGIGTGTAVSKGTDAFFAENKAKAEGICDWNKTTQKEFENLPSEKRSEIVCAQRAGNESGWSAVGEKIVYGGLVCTFLLGALWIVLNRRT